MVKHIIADDNAEKSILKRYVFPSATLIIDLGIARPLKMGFVEICQGIDGKQMLVRQEENSVLYRTPDL
jgi:hypothetical protein